MKSEEWKACHVRQSQYFLQIVKCTDPRCCSNFQSSYLKVAPKRFLPPPLPVVHTRNGIEWAKMLPTYPCIRTFPCKMP